MAKLMTSFVLLAALCYLVEGAELGDMRKAIGLQGNLLRKDIALQGWKDLGSPASWKSLPKEQRACIAPAIETVARAIGIAQKKIGLEGKARAAELAGVSVEDLNNEVGQQLRQAVQPVLAAEVERVKACIQAASTAPAA